MAAAVDSVELPVLPLAGGPSTVLRIHLLPAVRRPPGPWPLLDLRDAPEQDVTVQPIQLLEGLEYRYEFTVHSAARVSTNRPEVFEPDDDSGRTGRLRPGLYTGTLPISIDI